MADNDDLTGFIPDPPSPDGERRSKAIDAALRRFDAAHARPDGDDLPARPAAPNRARVAVLASAALVVLVTVPMLMSQRFGPDSMVQAPQSPATDRSVSVDLAQPPPPSEEAPLAEVPPPVALRAVPEEAIAPSPPLPVMIAPPLAAPPAANRAAPAAPRVAEAASPERPPSPPGFAPAGEASAQSADALVVTGSRVSRAEAEQAARARPPAPTGRQISEWRACTVADPGKDAQTCAARYRAAPAAADIARGIELAFRSDNRSALKAFDKALAAAPGSTTALLNRGLVRERLGDRNGAMADFDRAIRTSPDDARGYYFRSLLRRRSGDGGNADDDLAKAMDLAGRQAPER